VPINQTDLAKGRGTSVPPVEDGTRSDSDGSKTQSPSIPPLPLGLL